MNYTWKKTTDEEIQDLASYVKNYISKFPGEYEIFIGTDSQKLRKRWTVLFAMVICIYRKGKGAHIIYAKHKRSDIKDKLTRLRMEIVHSLEIANYLSVNDVLLDPSIMTIHIDINPNAKYASNKIYAEAMGWIRGCGYEVAAKPDAYAASYAADYICKNKDISFENK